MEAVDDLHLIAKDLLDGSGVRLAHSALRADSSPFTP
jgi:hypothetical protein